MVQLGSALAEGQGVATAMKTELESLKTDLEQAEEILKSRLDELSEECADVVSATRIPSVSAAKSNRDSYIPVLNGKAFEKFSPVGGGIRIATQMAY